MKQKRLKTQFIIYDKAKFICICSLLFLSMSYIRGEGYEWFNSDEYIGRVYKSSAADKDILAGYGVTYCTVKEFADETTAILAGKLDNNELEKIAKIYRKELGVVPEISDAKETNMSDILKAEVSMKILERHTNDKKFLDKIADSFCEQLNLERK